MLLSDLFTSGSHITRCGLVLVRCHNLIVFNGVLLPEVVKQVCFNPFSGNWFLACLEKNVILLEVVEVGPFLGTNYHQRLTHCLFCCAQTGELKCFK